MGATADWQVYLLHFAAPIGNTASCTGYAQHYTGSTPDLPRRLAAHRAGSDVAIMRAVRAAGIGFVLARTWPGGRIRERQIKLQGSAKRVCPVCKGASPMPEPEPPAPPRRAHEPRSPRLTAAEPPPLWESAVARLSAAAGQAMLRDLEAAERTAWKRAEPAFGTPGYDSLIDQAAALSRQLGAERDAALRLAEARDLAVAEGWWPEADLDPHAQARAAGLGLDLEPG